MLLHEAVRKARQELSLSQKKLAEQAGIQRRQLATLEKGGNITLATLRKVIAQLPNLETFTIDAVNVNVNLVPTRFDERKWNEAMRALGNVFSEMADAIDANLTPSMSTMQALHEANMKMREAVVPDIRRTPRGEGGAAGVPEGEGGGGE
jgi:transcriptional regulator with XRE-family HTH domain